jgi:hypothetical protein
MSDSTIGGSSRRDVMNDLAGAVREQVSSTKDHVARQVQDQVSHLADSAKSAASGATARVRNAAEDQKNAGADFVSSFAGAVRIAADAFETQSPLASDYIRRAARQIDGVSDSLRQRDVGELLSNVQDFARRQPTAFLGISALAGFAAVRFLKSSATPRHGEGRLNATAAGSENERHLAGAARRMQQPGSM